VKIGFLADTHIGYAARCATLPNGRNSRVDDGYQGLEETVSGLIEESVDVVLHGGDLFHVSHPQISDIVEVRRQFLRLHHAGIEVIGITGNHDFSTNRNKLSATSAVSSPEQGIHIYEQPYVRHEIADGIVVHAVSHLGVLHSLNDVSPEPGKINILLSHGIAAIPGHELFACADSPGEAVLDYSLLTQEWSAVLLGHYHQQGTIADLSTSMMPALYAGSLLRRGFSDKPGNRGWVMLNENGGNLTVDYQQVSQRAQYDLPVIDATALSSIDIAERVRENLSHTDVDGAIIRQQVINTTPVQRQGISATDFAELTELSLQWRITFPTNKNQTDGQSSTEWTTQGPYQSLDETYAHWVPTYARVHGLSDSELDKVAQHGVQYLLQANEVSQ
jgi:DNA repair exonuclease SbcCD nuclease subunit